VATPCAPFACPGLAGCPPGWLTPRWAWLTPASSPAGPGRLGPGLAGV